MPNNHLIINFHLRNQIKKMQFKPKYFVSGNAIMDYRMMALKQVIHTRQKDKLFLKQ